MEQIRELGVDLNAPASEYLPVLVSLPLQDSLSIRDDLFKSASALGLAAEGDVLVSRRDTRKHPLCHKLADDIIFLLHCQKNETHVPRSLLKNGKHTKNYLDSSRQSELAFSQVVPKTGID